MSTRMGTWMPQASIDRPNPPGASGLPLVVLGAAPSRFRDDAHAPSDQQIVEQGVVSCIRTPAVLRSSPRTLPPDPRRCRSGPPGWARSPRPDGRPRRGHAHESGETRRDLTTAAAQSRAGQVPPLHRSTSRAKQIEFGPDRSGPYVTAAALPPSRPGTFGPSMRTMMTRLRPSRSARRRSRAARRARSGRGRGRRRRSRAGGRRPRRRPPRPRPGRA